MWPTEWPSSALAIATATDAALLAVRTGDADTFDAATIELAALPFEQVVSVHFRIVRELMELVLPDGLEGDDVQDVLQRCARSAAAWWPNLDVGTLAIVLTGALGVGEVDETTTSARDRPGTLASAILVIADLGAAANTKTTSYIARAISDIARAETMEMP